MNVPVLLPFKKKIKNHPNPQTSFQHCSIKNSILSERRERIFSLCGFCVCVWVLSMQEFKDNLGGLCAQFLIKKNVGVHEKRACVTLQESGSDLSESCTCMCRILIEQKQLVPLIA